MLDAKFKSGSFSICGDMTLGYLSPENGSNLRKVSSNVQNRSPESKIDSHVNFSNFQAEEIFHFQNFCQVLMRKEQQQPPLPGQAND